MVENWVLELEVLRLEVRDNINPNGHWKHGY
jgi:hypothetical protein